MSPGGWLAELDGHRVVVEVPATTANLGAGYDCLGMALAWTDRIGLEVRTWARGAIELAVEGEGAGELPADRRNRFVRGLEAVLSEVRGPLPDGAGWRIEMVNRIPLSRGLGSSAAATVGGVLAGNRLLGDPLGVPDLLRITTSIEGHPDNAAPALLGGIVASAALGDGGVEAVRIDVPPRLKAVALIPELRLDTGEMRRVLPASVPRADAVANLARVAVGVAGLAAGRTDILSALTEDRLHEPYRAAAYPALPALVAAARAAGALGAFLSGAGSTVLALTDDAAAIGPIVDGLAAAARHAGLPARAEAIDPRDAGARVVAAG
jgi:homoserine kinase